jgi:hypothetical protein
MSIAREYDEDELVVVQETEYTGAGKHPTAQLTLAREMGVELRVGPREDDRPGERIVLPAGVEEMGVTEVDLDRLRRSYLRRIGARVKGRPLQELEVAFLAADLNTSPDAVSADWERAVSTREEPAIQGVAYGG